MLTGFLDPPSRRRLAVAAACSAGIALTLWLGNWRRGTDDFLFDYDARFWFLGGVMWLRGDSPYAHEPFLRLWTDTFGERPRFPAGFVYPGTILPLSLLLGSFRWETARWVMRAVNVAAFAGTLVVLRGAFVRGCDSAEERARRGVWIGAAAAVPGAALTMFQGQMPLIVTLGICLLWAGSRSGRTWAVVAGIFLASMKPQIAIVAVLFLVAHSRDRRAWAGVAAVAAACAAVLLWTTPGRLAADLAGSIAEHTTQEFNHADSYDSLVGRLGGTSVGRIAQWAGVVGGCAAAAVLGGRARRSNLPDAEIRLFQIALAVTAVVMPVHRYDLAIHLPLVATGWALRSSRRAGVILVLVTAHGWAMSFAWHLGHDLGLSVGEHAIAGCIATAELVLLLAWWHRDGARSGGTERGGVPASEGAACVDRRRASPAGTPGERAG